MSLKSELKTLMVTSTICEIDELEKGDIACADKMLNLRHAAYIRMYIMGCLEDEYTTYKAVIEYCYEQVKEILQLLITKKF